MTEFIFFVRLEDGRIQEWSFSADSTEQAVRLLRQNTKEDIEIRSCYKQVKSWKRYDIKKVI